MVELFAAGCLARSPMNGLVHRFRLSRERKLPTPARLSEPRGPSPLGGISAFVAVTRFDPLRPGASCAEVFLRRPASRAGTLLDRTRRLASTATVSLLGKCAGEIYFREPPSSTDKRLSTHPALRAVREAVGDRHRFRRLATGIPDWTWLRFNNVRTSRHRRCDRFNSLEAGREGRI